MPEPPRAGLPEPQRRQLDEDQARRIGRIVVVSVAALLLILFVLLNTRQVKVSFVLFSAEVSLIFVILLSAVGGAVIASVLPRVLRRRFFDGD